MKLWPSLVHVAGHLLVVQRKFFFGMARKNSVARQNGTSIVELIRAMDRPEGRCLWGGFGKTAPTTEELDQRRAESKKATGSRFSWAGSLVGNRAESDQWTDIQRSTPPRIACQGTLPKLSARCVPSTVNLDTE